MVNKITMWLILEPLLYIREFMHLADISRRLRIPHPTLRKYLNDFEKIGIVIKQFKGGLTMYKLNYTNPLIEDYIQLIEKERLIDKCQKELLLREIISFTHENVGDKKLLIFGSATKDIKKANDIDLLALGDMDIKEKLKLLEKKLNINFHVINIKKIDEIS